MSGTVGGRTNPFDSFEIGLPSAIGVLTADLIRQEASSVYGSDSEILSKAPCSEVMLMTPGSRQF
jgi:hypothetical protein